MSFPFYDHGLGPDQSAPQLAKAINAAEYIDLVWQPKIAEPTMPYLVPLPGYVFDAFEIYGQGFSNVRWDRNRELELSKTDDGIITFKASGAPGVMVVLSPEYTDRGAYIIVLNDDAGRSYITRNDRRVPLVMRDDYHTRHRRTPAEYWMTYKYGKVAIGEGTIVGAKTILAATDPQVLPGIIQIGFGKISHGEGVHTVTDIQRYGENKLRHWMQDDVQRPYAFDPKAPSAELLRQNTGGGPPPSHTFW